MLYSSAGLVLELLHRNYSKLFWKIISLSALQMCLLSGNFVILHKANFDKQESYLCTSSRVWTKLQQKFHFIKQNK